MNLTAIFHAAKEASRQLRFIDDQSISTILMEVADAAEQQTDRLLTENKKDLDRMDPTDPKYDRLKLTKERLADIASDMRHVAGLPSPLGTVLADYTRPNGMQIKKVRVAFGVIGIIYESRPNVSFDVFSLCLRSGNACILKGSRDAHYSNEAIVAIIHDVLHKRGMNPATCTLLPSDREATQHLMHAVGWVDLIIPRGSAGLIQFVRENAKIPVIETGAGICHTYIDKDADIDKGKAIIFNAKTRRPSVCNALDCLVIHQDRLGDLPKLCADLATVHVRIWADEEAYKTLNGLYPAELLNQATTEHFGIEFLSLQMSIKTVQNLKEALDHIAQYSSMHSECIVSEDETSCAVFAQSVDAACVYANVSTAFTDGSQFGLGAEIGISTQKLHARGPMALEELTTYKWLVRGDGQIRK